MSHVNPSNTSITLIWSEQWRPLWWLSGVGIVFLLLLIPLFWIDRRRAWSMCVYGCAPFLVLVCHSSTHGGRLLSHRLTLCCVLGAAAVELPPVGVEASSRLVTSHKKRLAQCSAVYLPVGHHPGLVSQKPKHESQEINNVYLEVLVFLPIFIVKKV